MTAQEFVNSIDFPVISMVTIDGRREIAILPDTYLPFELDEVNGEIIEGIFLYIPKPQQEILDFNLNTIRGLIIENLQSVWELQLKEYEGDVK